MQATEGRGLAPLAEQAGILLYTGTNTMSLTDIPNAFAVPMDQLWNKDIR